MRRAARQDGNHGRLVKVFEQLGCKVLDMSGLGAGAPDLLVGVCPRFNVLVEIKDPEQPPSKQRLTPDQKKFHAGWTGTVHLARTEFDCEELVKYYRALYRLMPNRLLDVMQ